MACAALGTWYRECLGLNADEHGVWEPEAGVTVFATFPSDTDYFGSGSQQTMLNFRVRDLDAMLAQLRAKGAAAADETQEMEGVGRFGWVTVDLDRVDPALLESLIRHAWRRTAPKKLAAAFEQGGPVA